MFVLQNDWLTILFRYGMYDLLYYYCSIADLLEVQYASQKKMHVKPIAA